MARVKDWLIDMEELTWSAMQKGYSISETIAYVRRHLKTIDENYIRQIYYSD